MYEPLTKWWFWVTLPFAFVVFGRLDRALSSYSWRYWRRRGQQPPPHRTSYLDAGRLVSYAVVAGLGAVVLFVEGDRGLGASLAVIAVVCGWFGLDRARRNVI